MSVSLIVAFVASWWVTSSQMGPRVLMVYNVDSPMQSYSFDTQNAFELGDVAEAAKQAKSVKEFYFVIIAENRIQEPFPIQALTEAFSHQPRIKNLTVHASQHISDLIPPLASSEIGGFTYYGVSKTSEILEALSRPGHPRLTNLKIQSQYGLPVGPMVFREDGLRALSLMTELRFVTIVNQGVSDNVAEAFCLRTPVTELKLDHNPVTGTFFQEIPASLERLSLFDCRLRDGTITAPRISTNLKALDLSDNQIGDRAIATITPSLKRCLRQLWLKRTDISDSSLECLAQCEELQELDLSQCRITRFPHNGFSKLEALDLSETQINDEALDFIEHLPKLKRLNLGGNCLSDAAIDRLAKGKELEYIAIYRTEIDGEALARRMPNAKLWRRGEGFPWIINQSGAISNDRLGQGLHVFGGFLMDPQQTDIDPRLKKIPSEPLQDANKE